VELRQLATLSGINAANHSILPCSSTTLLVRRISFCACYADRRRDIFLRDDAMGLDAAFVAKSIELELDNAFDVLDKYKTQARYTVVTFNSVCLNCRIASATYSWCLCAMSALAFCILHQLFLWYACYFSSIHVVAGRDLLFALSAATRTDVIESLRSGTMSIRNFVRLTSQVRVCLAFQFASILW
jgi:hypothetical protein